MRKPRTIVTPITRGDDYRFTVSVSRLVYTEGGSLFFAVKRYLDDDDTDGAAVLKQELTDADITDDTDPDVVFYELAISADETGDLAPMTYHAEMQWVSADQQRVMTFPAPEIAQWWIAVGADVNRRIETEVVLP